MSAVKKNRMKYICIVHDFKRIIIFTNAHIHKEYGRKLKIIVFNQNIIVQRRLKKT